MCSKSAQLGPKQETLQQVSGWLVIKAPLTFLEIEIKMVHLDTIVASQIAFDLAPVVLDFIDVDSAFAKQFKIIDAVTGQINISHRLA